MKHTRLFRSVSLAILTAIVVVLQTLGSSITLGTFSISLVLIPIVVGAAMFGIGAGSFLGAVFGLITYINCWNGTDVGGSMVFAANPYLCAVVCIGKGAAAGFLSGMVYRFVQFLTQKLKHRNLAIGLAAFSGILITILCLSICLYVSSFDPNVFVLAIVPSIILGTAAGYLLGRAYANGSEKAKYLADSYLSVFASAIIAPVANTGLFCLGMLLFFQKTLTAWAGGTPTLQYIIFGLAGVNFLIELCVNLVFAPALSTILKANHKKS